MLLHPSEPQLSKEPQKLLFGRFDAGQAIRVALAHPSAVFAFMVDDFRISKGLQVSRSRIVEWRKQLVDVDQLPMQLASRYRLGTGNRVGTYSGGGTIGPTNEVLYFFVRSLRPRTIVETGVASGFSSAYMLQALHDNEFGELLSIDLPTTDPSGRMNEDGVIDGTYVASPDQTGLVVPLSLRDRWTLLLGSSKDLLPEVLSTHSPIDVFFHDSSHSYQNMLEEYRLAWPHIRPGGWLLSDDINWNRAFADFSREVNVRSLTWERGHRGGLIHQ